MHLFRLQRFLQIYILHGSVATQLRYGGIFNNRAIANFLQNVPVNEFPIG